MHCVRLCVCIAKMELPECLLGSMDQLLWWLHVVQDLARVDGPVHASDDVAVERVWKLKKWAWRTIVVVFERCAGSKPAVIPWCYHAHSGVV